MLKIPKKVPNSLFSITYGIRLINILIKILFYTVQRSIHLTVLQTTTKIVDCSFKLFEKEYCGW